MFQSSKCDGKTTSPLWQSRSYQPGEFLFLLFTSSSFLHALRFAAILCKCVTCLSVLFTRYLCDTVLNRSKEKHQVQTFGAILLVWLPSCCRLTWTVSYTEVSVLLREVVTQIRGHTVGPPPTTVCALASLVDWRRIVPTHAITCAVDSLCRWRTKKLIRRVEPMSPTLLGLCVLCSH